MLTLAPSDIHFLQQPGLLTPDDEALKALIRRFEGRIPKVQVAEKDGAWFALNNSYLHIARDLERRGQCARVGVEVVPLTRVPKTLQESMIAPVHSEDSSCRSSWSEAEESSSYTSSDYSDDDLSDSEYEEDFICSICERRFSSFRLLELHRRNRCHVCHSAKGSIERPLEDVSDGEEMTNTSNDPNRPPEEMERLL